MSQECPRSHTELLLLWLFVDQVGSTLVPGGWDGSRVDGGSGNDNEAPKAAAVFQLELDRELGDEPIDL